MRRKLCRYRWDKAQEQNALTLAEILVAVAVVGITAAASVMYFGGTVARTRCRAARDTLMTIYTGEQVYFNLNGKVSYYPSPPGILNSASGMQKWRDNIFTDDPSGNGVTYQVTSTNPPPIGSLPGFVAQATYGVASMQINQNRTLINAGWDPACP